MVGVALAWAAGGRLVQFLSFPGRQLLQDFIAFTQAQPLQEPVLLHLQHTILRNSPLTLAKRFVDLSLGSVVVIAMQ